MLDPSSLPFAPRLSSRVGVLSPILLLAAACSEGPVVHDHSDPEHQHLDAGGGDLPPAECRGRADELSGLELQGTEGGVLAIAKSEPSPPALGNNTLIISLSSEGEAIEDAEDSLLVTPHMPDHGHGTPVAVKVTELEPGMYQLSPVNMFMPGYWQITIELENEAWDTAFTFGVCVE